jgi:hypothetical protein
LSLFFLSFFPTPIHLSSIHLANHATKSPSSHLPSPNTHSLSQTATSQETHTFQNQPENSPRVEESKTRKTPFQDRKVRVCLGLAFLRLLSVRVVGGHVLFPFREGCGKFG